MAIRVFRFQVSFFKNRRRMWNLLLTVKCSLHSWTGGLYEKKTRHTKLFSWSFPLIQGGGGGGIPGFSLLSPKNSSSSPSTSFLPLMVDTHDKLYVPLPPNKNPTSVRGKGNVKDGVCEVWQSVPHQLYMVI